MSDLPTNVLKTPMFDAHVAQGGRMVDFAGYALPVQYRDGIVKEHLHTRAQAGIFDVSHMGQAMIDDDGDPARALEALVPGDLANLKPGQSRYTLLLNDDGGILDDLIVTRLDQVPQRLFVVVNAANKDADFAYLRARLAGKAAITEMPNRALIALQGPKAHEVLTRFTREIGHLRFMQAAMIHLASAEAIVTRSGYTGEDGFELSLPAIYAPVFWDRLLREPEVKPIGLGARDSLRLEAGLCLHGRDIDASTNPIEANLAWTIPKRRREAADFPGAAQILATLAKGPERLRVGLALDGRLPAREGAEIQTPEGALIGRVTSGGFAPSLNAPIAMGYVAASHAAPGTSLHIIVRGQKLVARVVPMPFTPPRQVKA